MSDVVAKVVSVRNDGDGKFIVVRIPRKFEVECGDIVRLKVTDDAELIKREFKKVLKEVIY